MPRVVSIAVGSSIEPITTVSPVVGLNGISGIASVAYPSAERAIGRGVEGLI